MRAPVLLRDDGHVCNRQDAFSASFIGIQNNAETSITQIGVERDYGSGGGGQYCYFAAYGPDGQYVDDYDCTASNNANLYEYFKITRQGDGFYHAFECGADTGGNEASPYANCDLVDANQSGYSSGTAVLSNEVDDCANNFFGTATNPVNYGTGTNPIQQQASSGGGYSNLSLSTAHAGSCSSGHYERTYNDNGHIMKTWDDQNGS